MTTLNGPLELALRLLILLEADFPQSRGVDELLVLDHMAVHSGDFGGPSSLHPAMPFRSTDIAARRDSVRAALYLLLHRQLADVRATGEGIDFSASETSHSVVLLLEADYAKGYETRIRWLLDREDLSDRTEVRNQMKTIVESWPDGAQRQAE